jgi:RNA polymerase sigma-70 factor (ECF subfamily)
MTESSATGRLLDRASGGDLGTLAELFTKNRDRLRRMVELRLDRRLMGRLGVSDVLQESYLEAARSFPSYLRSREAPFFLWLRCLTGRKLLNLHRHHLGAKARDVRREISLGQGGIPDATSEALAAHLLARGTSPSEAAMRAERRLRVEEALNQMDANDREVLVLRHFEQLSTAETAEVLGIREAAAVKRHLRALKRLKSALRSI